MFEEIQLKAELMEALRLSGESPVMFFKHSNTCGISSRALAEFQNYLKSAVSASIRNYVVVVQSARPVSNELSALLGVVHESPQAILVREGRAIWHDSHLSIKSGVLIDVTGSSLRQSGSQEPCQSTAPGFVVVDLQDQL